MKTIAIRTLLLASALVCLALGFGHAAPLTDEGNTIQRFLLVSASNDGGPGRPTLRYATTDARSMTRVLEEIGGVPKSNLITVEDPDVATLRAAMDQMNLVLKGSSAQGRKEVVVYYSGHADEEGLLLGKSRMGWKELRSRIEALPADVRITVLDACGSGAIVRAKGGQRRPAFLMDESSNMHGTAFLTSSTEDEVSQESDRLKASFFTHAFVSGLRGAADLNGDKKVTLGEAYQYAFQETLDRTESTTGGTQHPSRDLNLSGSGDVVLTDLRGSSAAIVLSKELQGRFYIRDAQGQLVAELHKPLGREIELGLSPGNYQVRQEIDAVLETKLVLTDGGHVTLLPSNFTQVETERTRSRGGACTECTIDPDGWRAKARSLSYQNWVHPLMLTLDTTGRGMQLSLFMNDARQGLSGSQLNLSGLNMAAQGIDGTQIAGIMNNAGGLTNGLQISGLLNIAQDIKGAQISYINLARSSDGAQAGFINIASGTTRGVQASFVNLGMSRLSGVQAGFVNLAVDSSDGVQGGFVNLVTAPFSGVQGGFVNLSGNGNVTQGGFVNMTGNAGLQGGFVNVALESRVQLGFVNVARNSVVQVGFVNIADSATVPIGFLSFSRKGIYGVRGAIDEVGWERASAFSGTRYFFTEFEWGQRDKSSKVYSGGIGAGTRFGMEGPLWFSLSVTSNIVQQRTHGLFDIDWKHMGHDSAAFADTVKSMDFNVLERGKLEVGYNITPWLGITTGITANFLKSEGHTLQQEPIPDWQWQVWRDGNRSLCYWTGYQASIVVGRLGRGWL